MREFLAGFGHCTETRIWQRQQIYQCTFAAMPTCDATLSDRDCIAYISECENAKYAHNQSFSRTLPAMQLHRTHTYTQISWSVHCVQRTSNVNIIKN